MELLSVIIPVYNEAKTIRDVVEKVISVDIGIKKEIIIVDDCSTDNTGNIITSLNLEKKNSADLSTNPICGLSCNEIFFKTIFHQKNLGKGASIRSGLKEASGDIILIQDADREYNPAEYPKLLEPILKGNVNVVYGTRLAYIKAHIKEMNLVHYIGNVALTHITNILYGSKITDMETGYKIFRRKVLDGITLKATRFDFEPEITSKILKKGYRIHEVPITFNARSFKEGKKITVIDGLKALYYLLKYRVID